MRRLGLPSLLCLSLALGACGDSSDPDADADAGTDPADDGGDDGPLYALAASVFDGSGTTTYTHVLDSLDVDRIELAGAIENAGGATIGAHDGAFFIASGESPEITRYEIGADGIPVAQGTVSFSDYGLSIAPFYTNVFVDEDTAYMNLEQLERVIWDPSSMAIVGTGDAPGVPAQRDGNDVVAAFDRAIPVRDGHVFQPFYWPDADYYYFYPASQIAVYSAADDSLVDVLEAPCAGLDVATRDDEGNLYFSNWVFSVAAAELEEDGQQNCAVRIPAGETAIDADWTRSLSEITGGRPTAALRYVGDGVYTLAVFHEELTETGEATTADAFGLGANWKLWMVNLDDMTGAPVEGIERMAGGYYSFTFDGRTFVLLPDADYLNTEVYELLADGSAVLRFSAQGWIYQFVKIR